MRIAVLDLATCQEPADLDQLVDYGLVGITLATLAVEDVLAAEERQIGAEAAVVHHVVGDNLIEHPEVTVKLVLLHPVRRRTMDEPGAFLVRHEVGGPEIARLIPFAVRPFGPGERVGQRHGGQLMRGHVGDAFPLPFFQTGAGKGLRGKLVGKDEAFAHARPALVRRVCHFVEAVLIVGPENDRLVRRDRPRRRRPDHNVRAEEFFARFGDRLRHGLAHFRGLFLGHAILVLHIEVGDLELHPDREAFLVVILDLGLGQRGLLHRAPHHGLRPLIERAVHEKLHELFRDHGLGVVVHRQIGVGPVAGHT